MPRLLVSSEQAKRVLLACAQRGSELATKAELAERTSGYRDWLSLFATWREETTAELDAVYMGREVGWEFGFATETRERTSPSSTFPYAKTALTSGVDKLKTLVDRLELAVPESPDATALGSLHPVILSKCQKLYDGGDYAEAVEKSFKVVRGKLRALTGHETGSEAFGRGRLHVTGAAESHVDDDFQNGVKFLTMAIDRFRNEKSHTADGNISDPVRAYEYLRLSSLAMHLLDGAQVT